MQNVLKNVKLASHNDKKKGSMVELKIMFQLKISIKSNNYDLKNVNRSKYKIIKKIMTFNKR